MKQDDRAAFKRLISDVMAFYRQDVSEFALSVWWQACERFEFEQLTKALTAHAMDPERGQFAPKPADIVRQLQGTASDRSLVAWGKVMDAMSRVGAYASVTFDDGAIHCAIEDMGGWPKLCRHKTDDLPFLQKRFTDAHRAYSMRGGPWPSHLPGEHEQVNALNGHADTSLTLIGNPEEAKQIAISGTNPGAKTAITVASHAGNILRLRKSG